jgi:hypothetical protein
VQCRARRFGPGFTVRPMNEVMLHNPMNPGSADYDAIVSGFF